EDLVPVEHHVADQRHADLGLLARRRNAGLVAWREQRIHEHLGWHQRHTQRRTGVALHHSEPIWRGQEVERDLPGETERFDDMPGCFQGDWRVDGLEDDAAGVVDLTWVNVAAVRSHHTVVDHAERAHLLTVDVVLHQPWCL